MSTNSKIEWTDSTWSPIRVQVKADAGRIAREKGYASLIQIADKMAGRVGQHCEHVSPGCEHCYAETNNHRCLPANGTGLPYDRRSRDLVEAFVDEKVLLQPLKWKPVNALIPGAEGPEGQRAKGQTRKRRRRIFVENQSDLFGEWVMDEMLDRVFAVMALCPQHTFQVLTKRPKRMLAYCSDDATLARLFRASDEVAKMIGGRANCRAWQINDGLKGVNLPNVWLGVSVENQEAADARIPLLLQTPAAMRFISAEPLLGPIDLNVTYKDEDVHCMWNSLTAFHQVLDTTSMDAVATADDGVTKLDWVICGGESGPGARPMHPDWARSLRDQCAAAGVPFFFKQWGEWAPYMRDQNLYGSQNFVQTEAGYQKPCCHVEDQSGRNHHAYMQRVGKKAAGALLDGVEHKSFPVVKP